MNLSGDAGVKHSRLRRGRIRADYDFTVLKCEDIGRPRNAAEFIMQGGYSPITNNQDIDLVERSDLGFWAPGLPYKFAGNSSEAVQLWRREQNATLSISDGY